MDTRGEFNLFFGTKGQPWSVNSLLFVKERLINNNKNISFDILSITARESGRAIKTLQLSCFEEHGQMLDGQVK